MAELKEVVSASLIRTAPLVPLSSEEKKSFAWASLAGALVKTFSQLLKTPSKHPGQLQIASKNLSPPKNQLQIGQKLSTKKYF